MENEIKPGNHLKPALGIVLTLFLLTACTLGLPLIQKLVSEPISYSNFFWISRCSFWICLLFMILYAVKIEKTGLLIWKERPLSIPEGIATYVGLLGAVMIGLSILSMTMLFTGYKEDHSQLKKITDLFSNHQLLFVFTIITAGVVEELIFRGYLLPRLAKLFKNTFLAVLVTSALFGLLHLGYGNISQVIGPFWMGLVFAAFYVEYRNIKALIIFHTTWDLVSVMLSMYVKR